MAVRGPIPVIRGPSQADRTYVATNLVVYATLSTGQCCSLKIDSGTERVWYCRVGGGVSVEHLINGRWVTVAGSCTARVATPPERP